MMTHLLTPRVETRGYLLGGGLLIPGLKPGAKHQPCYESFIIKRARIPGLKPGAKHRLCPNMASTIL